MPMKFMVYRPESKIKFFFGGAFSWIVLLSIGLIFWTQVQSWLRGLAMMVILVLVGFYATYELILDFRRYYEITDKNLIISDKVNLAEDLAIPLNNISDVQYPKRRFFNPKHLNLLFKKPVTERRRILLPFNFSYSVKLKHLPVWISEKDKFVTALRKKCGLPTNS